MKAFFVAVAVVFFAGIGFAEEAKCLQKTDMPKRLLDSLETANAEMLLFTYSQFGETALFFERKNGEFFVDKTTRPRGGNRRGAKVAIPQKVYKAIKKIASLEVAAAEKNVQLGLDGNYVGAAVKKADGTWEFAEGWAHNTPPYLQHFKLFELAQAVSRAINANADENSVAETMRLADEFYRIDWLHGKRGFLAGLAEMLGLDNLETKEALERLLLVQTSGTDIRNASEKYPQIYRLRPLSLSTRDGGKFCAVLPWKCPAMDADEHVEIIVVSEDTAEPNCVASLKLSPQLRLVVRSENSENSICRNRSLTHSWESRNCRKKRKVLPLRREVRLSLH